MAGFAHRARLPAVHSPDLWQGTVLCVLAFLLYVVAIARAARRIGSVPPDEAQALLFHVAGIGFVLAFFALEML